jgi:hypothetical protein
MASAFGVSGSRLLSDQVAEYSGSQSNYLGLLNCTYVARSEGLEPPTF